MFTGIVEEAGEVVSFEESSEGRRLRVAARIVADVSVGDSVSVNGCCLTVVAVEGGILAFDLLEETVRVTGFGAVRPRQRVNLERSLRADARLGGHFVSGHVDAVGRGRAREGRGTDVCLWIDPPREFLKYLVYKGCVAVDGVSLTVAGCDAAGFNLWLIPHTLAVTNLGEREAGDPLNIECDLLAKYVERLMQEGSQAPEPQ